MVCNTREKHAVGTNTWPTFQKKHLNLIFKISSRAVSSTNRSVSARFFIIPNGRLSAVRPTGHGGLEPRRFGGRAKLPVGGLSARYISPGGPPKKKHDILHIPEILTCRHMLTLKRDKDSQKGKDCFFQSFPICYFSGDMLVSFWGCFCLGMPVSTTKISVEFWDAVHFKPLWITFIFHWYRVRGIHPNEKWWFIQMVVLHSDSPKFDTLKW